MSEATVDADIFSMLNAPETREKGFLLLVNTYKEPIYWHIRRLVVSHDDAEDILQETFIKVYRFAGSYKGDSRLYTWLYRIATNECLQFFRQSKKWNSNSGRRNEMLVGEMAGHDGHSGDTILVKFQEAILHLPEKQRLVFNLRYYDELSYEDISQILNSSVNTLKTNYHYARERIEQYLKEHAE